MKFRLAILYGILTWICIYILSFILSPFHIDGVPYINILAPISIIIVTTIFGILYIREINTNEVKEGFYFGIMLFVCDLILDNVFISFFGKTINIDNSPIHIISMLIIFPLITTLLGYLAQMKVELN
ncbi:hypothetical protein [Methanobrevibacter sp. DSM 116169]|uniref:hypothetical protein n=1 Tax=Methanobrevibacter sp. DSM 116169 TaxID=3242727 RepID=UPI0038FC3894